MSVKRGFQIHDIRSKPAFCFSSCFSVWSFGVFGPLDLSVCSAVYRDWSTQYQFLQLLLNQADVLDAMLQHHL